MRLQGLAAMAALGFATPASAQEPDLSWLVGEWCAPKDDLARTTTCERWKPMADGVMQGLTIIWHERFWTAEDMRITVEPDRLVFHAEPAKQKPTDFYATGAQPAMTLRFENRAHDYPQVVRYWREGELLMAEISHADGSNPTRWTYQRKER
jgi:hypothetical protein